MKMTRKNNVHHISQPYRILALGLLLVAFFWLQIAAANNRSFWEDEALTGWLVSKNFAGMINNLHVEFNPPLYWILVYFWGRVFGTSEMGLRSFSILCLAVAGLVTYRFSKSLFNNQVAWIAGGLLVFSPLVLTYGSNARYYSLAAALTMLVIWMTSNYLSKNSLLNLGMVVLTGTALLYAIYFGAIVLIAINLWWAIRWWFDGRKIQQFLKWGVAQALILICFSPWLTSALKTVHNNFPATLGNINWLTGIFLRVGYLGYAYGVGEFISPLDPVAWLGIILVAALILFSVLKSSRQFWLTASILALVIVVSIGVNLVGLVTVSYWQNLPNRTFFVYPLFLIILAYGIDRLKRFWKWGALAAILLVYSVGIYNYFNSREVIKPILSVPWRQIMGNIQDRSGADAVVICTNEDFACSYYQARYGFTAHAASSWERLVPAPSEVWWVQSNLSNDENMSGESLAAFQSLQDQYQQSVTFNYAPQDQGIAMLKFRLLGYKPYEFRVVVTRFTLPIP
jgi:uncharacterized membrane protein